MYPVLSNISWIPAFAGMTYNGVVQTSLLLSIAEMNSQETSAKFVLLFQNLSFLLQHVLLVIMRYVVRRVVH